MQAEFRTWQEAVKSRYEKEISGQEGAEARSRVSKSLVTCFLLRLFGGIARELMPKR